MRTDGFLLAAFGIDGGIEGTDFKEYRKLSGKWLALCDQFLQVNGKSFDSQWNQGLSHLNTKWTESSGTALVTFSTNGRPAASLLLMSGLSPGADIEVLKLFVDSLAKTQAVIAAAASSEPFEKAFSLSERPAMIVVPWPDSNISEQDHQLVRELSLHIAGAFFLRSLGISF